MDREDAAGDGTGGVDLRPRGGAAGGSCWPICGLAAVLSKAAPWPASEAGIVGRVLKW